MTLSQQPCTIKGTSLGTFRTTRVLLILAVSLCLIVNGCSTDDEQSDSLEESEFATLGTFHMRGAEYEFRTFPEFQEAEAPCIGLRTDSQGGLQSTIVCPTGDDGQFAAAVNAHGSFFIVGFGLGDNESIASIDGSIRVITTDRVDGRRFFLLQLPEPMAEDVEALPVREGGEIVRDIPVGSGDGH